MNTATKHQNLTSMIQKVAALSEGHPDISAMYLLGSYGSGHERSRSDVDLGVLFNRDVDGFKRIELETEISNLQKKEVDLIDMRRSGPFLRHQIYKYGKMIYQDGIDFPFLFRADSIRDYLDTNHLRSVRRAYLYGEGDVIIRKLSKLKEYVDELRTANDISYDAYRSNARNRAFVERYIHIAIQTVFDIANNIISYRQWKEPETYRETFSILSAHGVLPDNKVADFQNMASFRNMLVHHYENVDDEVVYGIFKNRLGDFDIFQSYILEYLKKI